MKFITVLMTSSRDSLKYNCSALKGTSFGLLFKYRREKIGSGALSGKMLLCKDF